jgi:hypothetical protein
MAASTNTASIVSLNIYFPDDIERVLNSSREIQQTISGILRCNYYRIEQDIDDLRQISGLFESARHGSKNFSSYAEVVGLMDSYQSLLKNSLTICNDFVAPLFISSFKCHQLALNYLQNERNDLAMETITQVEESARKMTSGYEKLISESKLLGEKAERVFVALLDDQLPMCIKQREIEERQKRGESAPADSIETTALQANIHSLGHSIKSLGAILTILRNTEMFWKSMQRHRGTLIVDSEMIGDLIECRETEMATEGIESSYFNWLSLAKINQTVATAIRKAIG